MITSKMDRSSKWDFLWNGSFSMLCEDKALLKLQKHFEIKDRWWAIFIKFIMVDEMVVNVTLAKPKAEQDEIVGMFPTSMKKKKASVWLKSARVTRNMTMFHFSWQKLLHGANKTSLILTWLSVFVSKFRTFTQSKFLSSSIFRGTTSPKLIDKCKIFPRFSSNSICRWIFLTFHQCIQDKRYIFTIDIDVNKSKQNPYFTIIKLNRFDSTYWLVCYVITK